MTAKSILSVPVDFGNVSIGDETANLSIGVERDNMNIDTADKAFCNRMLKGRVLVTANGDSPDQKMLEKDMKDEIAAVMVVNSFRVMRKKFSTSLSFDLGSIDVGTLSHFAKRRGRLIVTAIEDAPEKAAKKGDKDEDEAEGEE